MKPMKEHRTIDMTQGPIAALLIRFAIPLLIGSLLQQLYNTVDAWVVGNFVSKEAYSAVGSVSQPIAMLIGIFTGLSSGATVVISQSFGARDDEDVRRAVATSIAMTMVLGVILSVFGALMTPTLVDWMQIPDDVRPHSIQYLRIYLSGLLGLFLYNMGTGILRAVGDSLLGLVYLLVATGLNVVLDLLFVLQFRMGVAGVAWATVISQTVSAVLVLVNLIRTPKCIRWVVRETQLHGPTFHRILKIGVPGAIQMGTMSFSNMFAVRYIHAFGSSLIAAWTTYLKLEQFVILPTQSIALACTTFTAQNIGGRNVTRAKKGIGIALLMSACTSFTAILLIMMATSAFITFFNKDPEVVAIGMRVIRTLIPIYAVNNLTLILSGALRGAGRTMATTVISMGGLVVLRQLYLFVMANFVANEIIPIVMAFPVGWIACAVGTCIYYAHTPLLTQTTRREQTNN